MFNDQADEDLMVMYQKGEVRAFEVLLSRHRKPVYNFILRFVGDRETSEDLLQEAFMRVIRGAEAYKRQAKFTTWLYTIARNLCIDQLRKGALRKHPSLDSRQSQDGQSGPTLGEQTADSRANVERDATAGELRLRIASAVETLPDDQREVFLMREVANLPFKEIADITGVPENTVKSRMRYALERLQAALSDYEEYARALK